MSSSRIESRFEQLRTERRAGLVTFTMGGDPGITESLEFLKALPTAGADIIEIGMPFSDPMADGPAIQAAGLRALKAGTRLKDILRMAEEFRKDNDETPLILMGYYNPVYHYGAERFCKEAAKAGVDGAILVDLPPEEEAEFTSHAEACNLALIRLAAPTSLGNRLPALLKSARGFVYYISVTGITGAKSADERALKAQVEALKKSTALPVAVGFGIKTPAQARAVGQFADAVVVGSAVVNALHQQGKDAALSFIHELRAALPAHQEQ